MSAIPDFVNPRNMATELQWMEGIKESSNSVQAETELIVERDDFGQVVGK